MRNILRAWAIVAVGLLAIPLSEVSSAEPPPIVSVTYSVGEDPSFPPLTVQFTARGEPLTWRGTLVLPVYNYDLYVSSKQYTLEVICYTVGPANAHVEARAVEDPSVMVWFEASTSGYISLSVVPGTLTRYGVTESAVIQHVGEILQSDPPPSCLSSS